MSSRTTHAPVRRTGNEAPAEVLTGAGRPARTSGSSIYRVIAEPTVTPAPKPAAAAPITYGVYAPAMVTSSGRRIKISRRARGDVDDEENASQPAAASSAPSTPEKQAAPLSGEKPTSPVARVKREAPRRSSPARAASTLEDSEAVMQEDIEQTDMEPSAQVEANPARQSRRQAERKRSKYDAVKDEEKEELDEEDQSDAHQGADEAEAEDDDRGAEAGDEDAGMESDADLAHPTDAAPMVEEFPAPSPEEEEEKATPPFVPSRALRRIHLAMKPTAMFNQRVRQSWNEMKALMGAHEKKKKQQEEDQRREKEEEDEHRKEAAEAKAAADVVMLTSQEAAAAAAIAGLGSDVPASAVSVSFTTLSPPPSSSSGAVDKTDDHPMAPQPPPLKRDLSLLPTSLSRMLQAREAHQTARLRSNRRRRRSALDPFGAALATRPNSCPPILQRSVDAEAERKIAPAWLQELASPHAQNEKASRRHGRLQPDRSHPEPVKDQDLQREADDMSDDHLPQVVIEVEEQTMASAEATEVQVTPARRLSVFQLGDAVARPIMQRAFTSQPLSSLSSLSVSAPSTPAGTSLMRELLPSAMLPPRVPTIGVSPQPSFAPAPAAALTSDGFAIPALPRSISLMGVQPLVRTSVSIAIGSRPTPVLLPAASSAAGLMSPMMRGLSGASPRVLPWSGGGGGAALRFGDSTPSFGDSSLLTSIPSSAPPPIVESSAAIAAAIQGQLEMAALQRRLTATAVANSVASPSPATERQPTPTPSPPVGTESAPALVASAATPPTASPRSSPGGMAAAAAPPLPSLPPPSLSPMSPMVRATSLGPAPTGGLQEWRTLCTSYIESHLKPPTRAQLASATRQPRQVLAAALHKFAPLIRTISAPSTPAVGSMPPPMSPLPRRPSLAVGGSTTGVTTTTTMPLLVRGVSTPTFSPMSPNLSRMSSWLHTHPTTPSATAVTPRQTSMSHMPMSPLGLAQQPPAMAPVEAAAAAGPAVPPTFSRQVTTVDGVVTTTLTSVVTVEGTTTTTTTGAGALAVPHTVSRVGSNFQAECPPMLTQKQREWEHSAYLHAHAAVHGFPRHLPPLPAEASASALATTHGYLPIPRIPRDPYSIASFPASASLALTSKRTKMRETMMGGRKAARRRAQKEEEEARTRAQAALGTLPGRGRAGRASAAAAAAAASLLSASPVAFTPSARPYALARHPPADFDPRDIWPWTWEEYVQRETEADKQAGNVEREARKRQRESRRERKEDSSQVTLDPPPVAAAAASRQMLYTHPSFQSFASLFPADSPFAKTHFDDDIYSPYFQCASFVRPPSPLQNPRVRSFSPVHVLSVPPTPLQRAHRTRFPSSLLSPAEFGRRMARLERGGDSSDLSDELYGTDGDEDDHDGHAGSIERDGEAEGRKDTERWSRKRARNTNTRYGAFEDDLESKSGGAAAAAGRASVRAPKPASSPPPPRWKPSSSPLGASSHRSQGDLPSPFGPNAGRFKRWRMVDGKRHVWWIDSTGKVVLGELPPEPTGGKSTGTKRGREEEETDHSDGGDDDDHDDDHHSRASDGSEVTVDSGRIIIKRSSLPASFSLARRAPPAPARPLRMADLSPSVRVVAAKTGVARMVAHIDEKFAGIEEEFDACMQELVDGWEGEE